MKKILIVVGSLISLVLIFVTAIYFWPLTSKHLQTGTPTSVNYEQASSKIAKINAAEKSEHVKNECMSKLYSHGGKTSKAVVMFHGITACPSQYTGLAAVFYKAGYNVYVPRTPHHGLPDGRQHGLVTADELVDYTNDSITIATGLGGEVGAVGLSGGGMLATWASEYRSEVRHLLALSPFYEPASQQAPKWQLPFLNILYGKGILPDKFLEPVNPQDAAFSYHALANYNIVTKNLKSQPSGLGLRTIAIVTSEDDKEIDQDLARQIPTEIASDNQLSLLHSELPASWATGHDIVNLDNNAVAKYQNELFSLYFDYYEGRDHRLL